MKGQPLLLPSYVLFSNMYMSDLLSGYTKDHDLASSLRKELSTVKRDIGTKDMEIDKLRRRVRAHQCNIVLMKDDFEASHVTMSMFYADR